MGLNGVPPRWEEYSKVGKLIPETRIVPFKVPLREEICRNLSDSRLKFTVDDLVCELSKIKLTLVVDLTMTTRFYNKEDLEKYGIKHEKLFIRGGGSMPKEADVKMFCEIISNHLKNNCNGIVGVHCTHGVNRTGYFICRYMIDYLGIMGSTSVDLFEKARGHPFDRENYREFLKNKIPNNFIEEGYSQDREKSSQSNSLLFSESSRKSIKTNYSDWQNSQEGTYRSSPNSYKRSDYYDHDEYSDSRNNFNLKRKYQKDLPDNQEFDNASPSSLMNAASFDNNNFSNYRSYRLSNGRGFDKSQHDNCKKSNDISGRNYRGNKYP